MPEPEVQRDGQPERLSRGGSFPGDAAAFLEGVVLPEQNTARRDAPAPIKSYERVAVVVGEKPTTPLKRTYEGDVFDRAHHNDGLPDQDGLKIYLIRSFENQRRAGGRMLAVALIVGGGFAGLMPLADTVVIPGRVVAGPGVKKIEQTGVAATAAEGMTAVSPESDELQIDAHLLPGQVGQVHKGQNAQIRFSAFNQFTTPELTGMVSQVSTNITRDPWQSGAGYYIARVSVPGSESTRLGERQPVAGMPVELFVHTGNRTVMSHLFKGITDRLDRLRER
jgi:hypothetical protein